MLMEFFKFDLRYQLRQPLLWVTAFVLGLMAFGATTSDAVVVGGAIGNVHRNAPVVVAQLLGAFTVFSMLTVTIFIAGAVLRDAEVGISDMLFATRCANTSTWPGASWPAWQRAWRCSW